MMLDLLCDIDHSFIPGVFPAIKKVFTQVSQDPSQVPVMLSLMTFFLHHGELLLKWYVMDFVTAFQNGSLEEEIFMQQPEGYVKGGSEHLVCKLEKSLYGLKQSPRCWNKAFTDFLKSHSFKQSDADPCIYIRNTVTLSIIAVYVDDLIIASLNEEQLRQVKQMLQSGFEMKDMGELHYCLGIVVRQNKDEESVQMQQKHYILSLLDKGGLKDCKTVSTPSDPNAKLKEMMK